MNIIMCCIIFYDSAQRYERFPPVPKGYEEKNNIINIYVRLYYSTFGITVVVCELPPFSFRSYDSSLGVKTVLLCSVSYDCS